MKYMWSFFIILSMSFFSIEISGQNLNQTDFDRFQSQSLEGFENFQNIVIFIRFKDEANYQAPFNANHYETMFNGVDTISVRDYYLEASYGKLSIDSMLFYDQNDLILYYTDIFDRNYYEPYSENNVEGYDEDDFNERADREHALLGRAVNYIDALGLIDPAIDLDVNNDGDIDALTFMVSGEDNGWASLLWPHQWYLYSDYYTANAPTINGLKAYTYTFNLLGNSIDYPVRTSVGVLAHETFHLLGAPDLYHYYSHTYMSNAGPWSLMDNAAKTPVHMLGYMKYQYGGWIDEVNTIKTPGTYTLEPLKDSPNNLYKFDTGYSNESVYFEFRYQEGFYESTLPSSGLLVYRVDSDHFGNQDGYSDTDNGPGKNEVFLFRPGIEDTTEPITFPIESPSYTFAGDIYDAALSQFNRYDEANTSTEFLMFHSDGTLMQIQITNVTIQGKTISFDISFDLEVNADIVVGGYPLRSYDYLIDHEALVYEASLDGVRDYDTYLSFDGDEATLEDFLYQDTFTFTSDVKTIHLSYYLLGEKVDDQIISLQYVQSLESEHFPYGNNVYIAYFIPYIDNLASLTLSFDANFELEFEYDYLYITDLLSNGLSFTGTSLASQVLDLKTYNHGIWIEFITDEYLDDFYGFKAEIDIQLIEEVNPIDVVLFNGEDRISIPYGTEYIEQAITISSPYDTLWTIDILSEINPLISGEYVVTYLVYDQNVLILTLYRYVTIEEPLTVSFNYIEDFSLELGSEPIIFESLVDNVSFNGSDYLVDINTSINYLVTGPYEVTIKVTDAYNFYSMQSLTVTIIDTTYPIVALLANVDTIIIGEDYVDMGIDVYELNRFDIVVENTLNINQVGMYTIQYYVTDLSNNQSVKVRYVHVMLPTKPNLVISDSVSTFLFGDEIQIPTCQVISHQVPCDVEYDQDTISLVGNHEIYFSFTYLGVKTTRIYYIFVLADTQSDEILYLPKKKDVYL